MSLFTVDLENHPGELARLCEAMAANGINLVLSATAHGDEGTVVFVADDEAAAQTALQDAGLRYAMRTALTIRMVSAVRIAYRSPASWSAVWAAASSSATNTTVPSSP